MYFFSGSTGILVGYPFDTVKEKKIQYYKAANNDLVLILGIFSQNLLHTELHMGGGVTPPREISNGPNEKEDV